jgi:GntR family transcriptional regulator/MocR family aminotransferase
LDQLEKLPFTTASIKDTVNSSLESEKDMLYLELDKSKKRLVKSQIYNQLREKILTGELTSGLRLPSSRELSNELNVSRNTVLSAYEMLLSEGYVHSIAGSGVYVNSGAHAIKHSDKMIDNRVSSLSNDVITQNIIDFDSGIPAIDLFPRGKWNRVVTQAFNEAPIAALGYDYPEGREELRKTLVDYLKKARGIQCEPEQIIITTGAKQGISLIAKCLLNQDSTVWIEDPTNHNVEQIFSYHTKHIIPIAVDEEGIQTELFPTNSVPTVIFVTPSHQFPMGGILSIQRRLQLADFARRTGCYIIEDDYDSEFRYNGPPMNSLYELNSEQVIYVGTFSKILFPSLRLGYLVMPFSLVDHCKEWKRLADHHSNSINQLALTRFIENGDLERYVMKAKKLYSKRRNYLISLLKEYFPGKVKIHGAPVGMHIVAEFDSVTFSEDLIHRMKEEGINVIPIEKHAFVKGKHTNQIILGYAHLSPSKLAQGIMKIKEILNELT